MFIGNVGAYNQLVKWLTTPLPAHEFDNNCICVVYGVSGIGKTYGINKALQEHGFTGYNVESISDIEPLLVSDHYLNIPLQRKVFILDNVDNVTTKLTTKLKTAINLNYAVKVIITTCNVEKKQVPVNVTCIRLLNASEADLILFVRENYTSVSSKDILAIVNQSNGNVSSVIQMIENFKLKVQRDIQYQNSDLYKLTNADEIARMVEKDPWIYPMRYHENLLNKKPKKDYPLKYLESLFTWDLLQSNLENTLLPVYYISGKIGEINKNTKNAKDIPDNFTKLFNNLSLKKKKKVANYKSIFPWQKVPEYWKKSFLDFV